MCRGPRLAVLLAVAALLPFSDVHLAKSAVDTPGGSSLAISIGSTLGHRRMPPGFVGLSLEISALEADAGDRAAELNRVLERLIRNLAPGQRPVLRLGGDSTDWSWWPVPRTTRPRIIRYVVTSRWLAIAHALATAVDARLILGVNLELDSARAAAAESRAMVGGIGRAWIQALELGNEPELYGHLPSKGSGRSPPPAPHVSFGNYLKEYSNVSRSLPAVALAGPSTGSATWMEHTRRFLDHEPRAQLLTLHRYPLAHCRPQHIITLAQLLTSAATTGLADGIASYVSMAHDHGRQIRVDEMNAVSCGGQAGVSNTFGAALWALQALFEMARIGVDGVNIHSRPSSGELFAMSKENGAWQAAVRPEYYGLMLFAQAAPAGSRLLRVQPARGGSVRAWATAGPDGRIRILAVNISSQISRTVTARVAAAIGSATVERLQAPSLSATSDITLGGQSFGSVTSTGLPSGVPASQIVAPRAGSYEFVLPPGSAALVTVGAGS